MLRFERPDKAKLAPDFDDHVAKARGRVEARTKLGKVPEPGFFGKPENQRWSKYKIHFMNAQEGKCGYCETYIKGTKYGDVEHYAPKALVQEIDRWVTASLSSDESWTARHGVREICKHGYHCLAYDWDNYLYACQFCNQRHKRSIFPVRHRPVSPCSVPLEKQEPLLLNPYGDVNPADHLAFDKLGQILARDTSPYGRSTIDTCRLDREELRAARERLARRIHRLVRELEMAVDRDDEHEQMRIERVLLAEGDKKQPYAGMVRAIYEQYMGVPWTDLEY